MTANSDKPSYGRLNWIHSTNPQASNLPVVVGIPGGPGLSAASLRGIEPINAFFDVALVDPPGTGGTLELQKLSVVAMIEALEDLVGAIGRPIFLVGHSFGGAYVGELVRNGRLSISAAAYVASPLTVDSAKSLTKTYARHSNVDLKSSESEFETNPTVDTFNNWLKDCSLEFFAPSDFQLASLILRDRSSPSTYTAIRAELPSKDLSEALLRARVRTLVIAGQRDRLIGIDSLLNDAQAIGANFSVVPGGSHFLFQTHAGPTVELLTAFFRNHDWGEK